VQEQREVEENWRRTAELPLEQRTSTLYQNHPEYEKWCLELEKKQEQERKEIERWRREKKPARAAAGVEVVEYPDGSRVVNGIRLAPLSNSEMAYRGAHEMEKREREAYRNLGGADWEVEP